MTLKLIIIFFFLTNAIMAQSMDFLFIKSEYDSDKIGKWTEISSDKVAYKFYFRGSCCCSIPVVENMRAEIVNDTLYIDKGIPIHEIHRFSGVCGKPIDFIIKKEDYPNYEKLIISFNLTKNRD